MEWKSEYRKTSVSTWNQISPIHMSYLINHGLWPQVLNPYGKELVYGTLLLKTPLLEKWTVFFEKKRTLKRKLTESK